MKFLNIFTSKDINPFKKVKVNKMRCNVPELRKPNMGRYR